MDFNKYRRLRGLPLIPCDYCPRLDPITLPRPFGNGRVQEDDPYHVVNIDTCHGITYNACWDCWRRGGRWRAKIRTQLFNC